jgi:hypothetical protein
MALDQNINTLEREKFELGPDGKPVVRVVVTSNSSENNSSIDGGEADSLYGGTTPLDGGRA